MQSSASSTVSPKAAKPSQLDAKLSLSDSVRDGSEGVRECDFLFERTISDHYLTAVYAVMFRLTTLLIVTHLLSLKCEAGCPKTTNILWLDCQMSYVNQTIRSFNNVLKLVRECAYASSARRSAATTEHMFVCRVHNIRSTIQKPDSAETKPNLRI
jgi:hypothetical protein